MTIRELIAELIEAIDIDKDVCIGTGDGKYYAVRVTLDHEGALFELGEHMYE